MSQADAYLGRARRDLASAKALAAIGDGGGAANRAYYAVFQAARAVVSALADIDPQTIKTHSGLRRHFELCAVKPGLMDRAVARHFNDVEGTRLVADYTLEPLDPAEIVAAIEEAERFVTACASIVGSVEQ
jgi:uncharacterized protein (UPF0332 family)